MSRLVIKASGKRQKNKKKAIGSLVLIRLSECEATGWLVGWLVGLC